MIVTGYKIDQVLDQTHQFQLGITEKEEKGRLKVKFAERTAVPLERQMLLKNNYSLLRELTHRNIPKAIDFRTDKKHIALITEFVEGVSIAELTKEKHLSAEESVRITLDIARILDYLFGKKIIHQSISPSNVIRGLEGEAYLINFDKATNQEELAQEKVPVRLLPYELDYCSPEQTGRVNRKIDYRTDYYGLGMVMYKMLTGKKPFESGDSLELVHAQIAKVPEPVEKIVPGIAPAVSRIVSKLLAKNAEDRYQSAAGLIFDLERCLSEIREGKQPDFEIGKEDMVDRFIPPQRLVGREKEVKILLDAFNSVKNGHVKLVMVAGYSGVGKTALIEEIAKPVLSDGGLLVKGKADQFQNIPYSPLVEASKEFFNFILKEDEKTIRYWRDRIIDHVGDNLSLLTVGLPGLDQIVGPQKRQEDLSPTDAENRYTQVVFNYLQAIAPPDHPLVIFIDDLQWVDQATLDMVEKVVLSQSHSNLMFIGSYRNNEVDEDHPLVSLIKKVKSVEGAYEEVSLLPLTRENIHELVSDIFSTVPSRIIELADTVYNKTFGNPFFTIQLLRKLYDERIVHFDKAKKEWAWDPEALQDLNISENVVDLMLTKIMMLPETTRQLICMAAPIGTSIRLDTHAKLCGMEAKDIIGQIFPAVQEKMLQLNTAWFPYMLDQHSKLGEDELKYLSSITFSFIHDRVQQAAYSLIPEAERQALHYKLGNILAEEENSDENIYDIVFHLNESVDLITSIEEKERLARLNLKAGKKSNRSNAFDNAISYLQKGIAAVPGDEWKENYELMFNLYHELAWAETLVRPAKEAEITFGMLLKNSKSPSDRLLINTRRVSLYTKIGDFKSVIAVTKESLKEFGISFPERQLALQLAAMRALIGTTLRLKWRFRQWSDIEKLKQTNDPVHIRINNLLVEAGSASYSTSQELMVLTMLKVLNRSLDHGATESTPWSFQAYAVIAGSFFKWYKAGYEIGRSSIELGERVCGNLQRARLPFVQASFITHWRRPLREELHVFYDTYQKSRASGDTVNAYNSLLLQTVNMLGAGIPLPDILASIEKKEKQFNSFDALIGLFIQSVQKQFVLALMGRTRSPESFEDASFTEKGYIENEIASGNSTAYYYSYKLQLLYYTGNYEEAARLLPEIQAHLPFVIGLYMVCEMEFFSCLVRLQLMRNNADGNAKEYRKAVKAQLKTFKVWAKNAPENFQHQYDLLRAEWHAIKGDKHLANDLFDNAIEGALKNRFSQNHAICLERAGAFYLQEQKREIGETLLKKAWKSFDEWGAISVREQFTSRYPDITFYEPEEILSTFEKPGESVKISQELGEILDFNSLLKASQNLSSTLKLEQVLQNLMQVLMENAAAQKIALIMDEGGTYELTAYKDVEDKDVSIVQQPVQQNGSIVPVQVINYCFHTRKLVQLSNANSNRLFASDPYIQAEGTKSILCFPIVYNEEIVGVIYLENNLIEGAFTNERIEVLNLLSSQIAVSLMNSQLYENLEKKVEQRTREIQLAKEEIENQKVLIEREKEKSDELLLNILPESIAEELKTHGAAKARKFDNVSVLFVDIVGFTLIAQELSPDDLVKELDYYFKAFDDISEKYGLEKIKTIGDSFMAACGVPEPKDDHAVAIVKAALEMRNFVEKEKTMRQKDGRVFFETRLGIHSGKVIAGVVGHHKFAFDIWGDTVNTASRLQSSSEKGKVNISDATYELVKGQFPCKYRGEIEGKNKGMIKMYFVE